MVTFFSTELLTEIWKKKFIHRQSLNKYNNLCTKLKKFQWVLRRAKRLKQLKLISFLDCVQTRKVYFILLQINYFRKRIIKIKYYGKFMKINRYRTSCQRVHFLLKMGKEVHPLAKISYKINLLIKV